MAEPVEDIDLLIEEYLDGRLEGERRSEFEARLSRDPELRERFNSATKSVEMLQQALGWMTPGEDFEERVSSKITSITQSGQNIRPFRPNSDGSLTSEDPDAKLLADPEAVREKRRLLVLGLVAALLFAIAAAAIAISISKGLQKPHENDVRIHKL